MTQENKSFWTIDRRSGNKTPYNSAVQLLIQKYHSGEMVDVETECKHLLNRYPHSVFLYNLLGAALTAQKKFDKAIPMFECALALDSRCVEAYTNLGSAFRSKKQPRDAIKYYKQALLLNPQSAQTYNNLGNALFDLGEIVQGVEAYQKALTLKPDYAEALNNLGNGLRESGRLEEAIQCFERAIQIFPKYADAYNNLGNVHLKLEAYETAVAFYNKAIQCQPSHAVAYNNLGNAFLGMGKIEKAKACYHKAIGFSDRYADAHNNLGLLYEKMNDLETSEIHINKAFALDPDSPTVIRAHALLLRRKGEYELAISLLEKSAAGNIALKNEAASVHFELGRLYDKKKEAGQAFAHFQRANRLQAEAESHIVSKKGLFLDSLDEYSNALRVGCFQYPYNEKVSMSSLSPCFIVGFPRSGTTLLDQILDSHSCLQVMEEKDALQDVIRMVPGYPNALKTLNQDDLIMLKARYFESVFHAIPRDNRCLLIDKFPLNICHIPLIIRLFPNAKIILSLRHPYDVVLSNFMQEYRLNPAMANFLDLADTARTYARVMALWMEYEAFFKITYHSIRYEDLVADTENQIRGALAYLDVDWEPSVLDFYSHAKKKEIINTPSYEAVTQPIYESSTYRWKRYEKALGPVIDSLRRMMTAFGYL